MPPMHRRWPGLRRNPHGRGQNDSSGSGASASGCTFLFHPFSGPVFVRPQGSRRRSSRTPRSINSRGKPLLPFTEMPDAQLQDPSINTTTQWSLLRIRSQFPALSAAALVATGLKGPRVQTATSRERTSLPTVTCRVTIRERGMNHFMTREQQKKRALGPSSQHAMNNAGHGSNSTKMSSNLPEAT